VKKSSSDGTWTVYIGDGIYEKSSNGSWIDYYNAFGRRIAMRKHTGPSDPGTVYYLLSDTLGSTSTVLNSTGAVVESEKYYPYGSLRSAQPSGGITLTDRKFTGQQDEGTPFGLYDYGARFYSTVIGRFTSADPLAPAMGNPQTWDRYAYAIDDPLVYTDPTGLCVPGVNCPDGLPEDRENSITCEAPYGPSAKDPLAPATPPPVLYSAPAPQASLDTGFWQGLHNLVDRGYTYDNIAGMLTGSRTSAPAVPVPTPAPAPYQAPATSTPQPPQPKRLSWEMEDYPRVSPVSPGEPPGKPLHLTDDVPRNVTGQVQEAITEEVKNHKLSGVMGIGLGVACVAGSEVCAAPEGIAVLAEYVREEWWH